MNTRTNLLSILTITAIAIATAGCESASDHRPARGQDEPKSVVNTDEAGVALQGYDPVAYFTEGKPTKGNPEYRATYKRATYHFATAAHRDAFIANPARYEPQFGGYCGYAASINTISPISVDYWEIIDGRLVLQHNEKAWDLWQKDVQGNLVKADSNWPGLVEKHGK